MITKRVFIASSSELKSERLELIDLFLDMETNDMQYRAVVWEFMDPALREKRKEDEYLAKLKQCEVCITMFWNTLGQYTVEELKLAPKEQEEGHLPEQNFILIKGSPKREHELEEYLKELRDEHTDIIFDFSTLSELRNIVKDLL